ncbi:MAG: hypothetical protein AB9880_08565 [Christensenellales bacterium]
MQRKALALMLAVCLMLPAALGEAALRGYDPLQGWQYAAFGSYPQGPQGEVQPILWRVLQIEGGLAYLMSAYALDVRRVDGDQWHYRGWEGSELATWLRGEFLQAAFSGEEGAALREREALGKVSLPSVEDLQNKALGFGSDLSRRIPGSPWALQQRGLYSYQYGAYSPIWTRTPSARPHAQRATKLHGKLGFIGVESDDLGVCPVIWLALDALSATGSGTQADPLVLTPLP